MLEEKSAEQTSAFNFFGLYTAARASRLRKILLKQKGVIAAGVNLSAEKVYVRFQPEKTSAENIIYAAKKSGFRLELQKENSTTLLRLYETERDRIKNDLLFGLILSSPLFLAMIFVWFGAYFPLLTNIFHDTKIQFVFATPVVLLIVSKHISATVKSSLSITALALFGSLSAYALSIYCGFFEKNARLLFFDTSVIILLAVHFAKYLDVSVKCKIAGTASKFIKASAAQTAKVIRDDGSEELIDAGGVKNDDILLVEPNEQIAADGIIVSGNAQIDESVFSGINIAVEKKVGDKVYAQTTNLANSFTIMVCGVGEETEFSKIVRTVENIQTEKTQTQKISEKFPAIFFLAALAVVLANVFISVRLGKNLAEILIVGASVLVVSCPCAFWLASSVAAAAGAQIGMKHGVFFKFAEAFSVLSKVKTLVLAKPETFGGETLSKAVEKLQKLKISVYMMTHENKISAEKVEKLTGISAKNISTGLNFSDKADFVKKIMAQEANKVAALGNGLNDDAALSQSDLGISIVGGNNVSQDVSGVALKNADLLNLYYGVKIAKKTEQIRKQNLFLAFFSNAAGITLVIMNVFNPATIASLTMVIGCACVAVNSLRIKKLKFGEEK